MSVEMYPLYTLGESQVMHPFFSFAVIVFVSLYSRDKCVCESLRNYKTSERARESQTFSIIYN